MTASAVGRLLAANNDSVKMPHVNVGRHFAVHVKWITLYNDKFWAFPEFIITPSLVVKLSTTTAPDLIGFGPLAQRLVSVRDLNDDDDGERRRFRGLI